MKTTMFIFYVYILMSGLYDVEVFAFKRTNFYKMYTKCYSSIIIVSFSGKECILYRAKLFCSGKIKIKQYLL